jgi:hypothetical protein
MFYLQQPAAPGEPKPGATAAGGEAARPKAAPRAAVAAPSAPAAQSATRGVQDNRLGVQQQQRAFGVESLDRLQRAVIIFRVVPERGAEAEARKEPSAPQKQP